MQIIYKSFRLASRSSSPGDWKDLRQAFGSAAFICTIKGGKLVDDRSWFRLCCGLQRTFSAEGNWPSSTQAWQNLSRPRCFFFREHWLSAHDLVTWESQQLGFQILSDPVRLLARGISLDISRSTSLRDKGGLQCFPTAAGDGEQAPCNAWALPVAVHGCLQSSSGTRLRWQPPPQKSESPALSEEAWGTHG